MSGLTSVVAFQIRASSCKLRKGFLHRGRLFSFVYQFAISCVNTNDTVSANIPFAVEHVARFDSGSRIPLMNVWHFIFSVSFVYAKYANSPISRIPANSHWSSDSDSSVPSGTFVACAHSRIVHQTFIVASIGFWNCSQYFGGGTLERDNQYINVVCSTPVIC